MTYWYSQRDLSLSDLSKCSQADGDELCKLKDMDFWKQFCITPLQKCVAVCRDFKLPSIRTVCSPGYRRNSTFLAAGGVFSLLAAFLVCVRCVLQSSRVSLKKSNLRVVSSEEIAANNAAIAQFIGMQQLYDQWDRNPMPTRDRAFSV